MRVTVFEQELDLQYFLLWCFVLGGSALACLCWVFNYLSSLFED